MAAELALGAMSWSPVQLELESCLDLKQFEQQHFHLVGGLVVALFLGAQVVLPQKGGSFHAFDMNTTESSVRQLFTHFWCSQAPSSAQKLWCGEALEAIRLGESKVGQELATHTWALSVDHWNSEELLRVGEGVWQKRKPSQISRLTLGCDLWSQLKISEGSQMFNWFWKLHDAIALKKDLISMSAFVEQKLLEYHPEAQIRTKKFGFQFDDASCDYGCYYVFQLCPEDEDYLEQCLAEAEEDPAVKCAENLLNLGNMLLSEGVNPSIPIYLITSLTDEELQKWKNYHSTGLLFQVYTVVTPQQLKLDLTKTPNRFAGVNYALSQEAELFIGTSSCSPAAYSVDARHAKGRPSLFFDRFAVPSQQFQWHQPPGIIFPVRPQIKWVFALPATAPETLNLTLAALKSALAEAPSLVPVCITTASPTSAISKHLVSLGVRLLHHQPTWLHQLEKVVSKYANMVVPFKFNLDQMVSRLLRMDIPISGILDQFVLYTDPDVLFTGDVTWAGLLGPNFMRLERLLKKKKLLKASFDGYYSQRNFEGLPKFFGFATKTSDLEKNTSLVGDTSVMLMNLKTLAESYFDFKKYVFERSDILWEMLVSLDPVGYTNFYVNAEGKTWCSRISPKYNSRVQSLRGENRSNITRFAGTNCDRDILPFLRARNETVAIPKKSKALLKQCGYACSELCSLYKTHLESGYFENEL